MAADRGPERPTGLGPAGRRLWRSIASGYDLRPDELILLESAARTLDTLAQIEAALVGAPLTVPGSAGQLREHPLMSEARHQRAAVAALLRQLALPDSDEIAAVRSAARSSRGRELARGRWSA